MEKNFKKNVYIELAKNVGFYIRSYRKTQMNFLVNPICV